MLDRVHPRYRRRRKTTNPWKATGDEPVVVTGITGIFEQNPAPKIRKLLHYWIKLRAAGIAPSREIVDVFQVSGLLPYIWLIDVVRNPRVRFRIGLIKTHVQRAHAVEPVARYLDEIEPRTDTATLCDYFGRVVAEARPMFRRGRPLMPWRSNFRIQQSLYLPLLDRAHQIDAILAISLFPGFSGPLALMDGVSRILAGLGAVLSAAVGAFLLVIALVVGLAVATHPGPDAALGAVSSIVNIAVAALLGWAAYRLFYRAVKGAPPPKTATTHSRGDSRMAFAICLGFGGLVLLGHIPFFIGLIVLPLQGDSLNAIPAETWSNRLVTLAVGVGLTTLGYRGIRQARSANAPPAIDP